MDRAFESPAPRMGHEVARLMGSLVHAEPLSAVLEHFGHEGKLVEPAVLIQRSQDLGLAPDFHKISRTQPRISLGAAFELLHRDFAGYHLPRSYTLPVACPETANSPRRFLAIARLSASSKRSAAWSSVKLVAVR